MTQLILASDAVPAEAPAGVESSSIGGQGIRFFLIGSSGTALQLGLYAATAALIGAQVASVASWLISTLVTNAAHRAFTFGVRGNERNRSDQIAAFVTCVVGLLVTSVVLAELPNATGVAGVIAILAVNTVVGAGRFVGMRWWLSDSGRRVGAQFAVLARSAKHASDSRIGLTGLHD
jgi:putative flippase GtrA